MIMRMTRFISLAVLTFTLLLILSASDGDAYRRGSRRNKVCRRLHPTLTTQCTRRRNSGSICKLSCREGYRLLGRVKQVICLHNRRWNRRVSGSRCIRIPRRIPVCPPLHESLVTDCTRERRVGSKCSLSCQPGYEMLNRLDYTKCLSIERWRPSMRRVRCTKALCPEKKDCGFLSDKECQSICPKHPNLECAHDCNCVIVLFDKTTGENVDVERDC